MDQNDPVISGLRSIMIALGGSLVTNGILSAEMLQLTVGAIVTIGLVLWSIISKRKTAIIASAATRLDPAVPSQRIITDRETAALIPSQKVTAS